MRQFVTNLILFIAFIFLLSWKASANDSDIVRCNRAWKIVVLGSSTAFGTGASEYDSSWVGKFSAYVKRNNAQSEVYNMGIPGYTTYQNLCPTGFSPPANRPAANASFNITAALALQPHAIIINMPSNDAANDYSLAEQQANFERAIYLADSANIPVWITTTQPRNNLSAAQVSNLMSMRDWINNRVGDKSVDFWSIVANPDGTINNYYDYDYVHVNNAGHELYNRRIKAETILDSLCARVTQTLVARAGNDFSVTLPGTSASLNGSASYSSLGGIITSYQWIKISGPAGLSILSPTTAVSNLSGLSEGRYSFSLTVTDNASNVKTDTVNMVVSSRILIDFGPDATPAPDENGNYWNNVPETQPGLKLSNAVTTGNLATSLGLQVVNRIDGTFNVSGPGTNTGNAAGVVSDYPTSATTDFAFAEASASNGQWTITGLESTKQYSIKFWGTRTVADDRIIQIKRADQSAWQEYNASGNSNYNNNALFVFSGKTQMSFDIKVKSGSAFGYISLIDISRTTPAQTLNVAPMARAGNVTVPLPASTATLDGSASGDDDGSITRYEWLQTSGPSTASLTAPTQAITAVSNLLEGIYTFRLRVTDDSSAVAQTEITVTVNSRILIDFGNALTTSPDDGGKYWNTVLNGLAGIKIPDAVNTGNVNTGIGFEIVTRLYGSFNPDGPGVNTGNINAAVGDYPLNAVADYAFAHNSEVNGKWKVSGLDSTKQYTVKFWGTRDAADERIIQIKPADASQWQQYDARNNTDYNNAAVFTFSGKTEKIFDIRVKDDNTFAHISLIDISVTNPPVNCSPGVVITSSQVAAVCAGSSITFNAATTNSGSQPVFIWKKNGIVINDVNAAVYTAGNLANNDSISCSIIANTNCYSGVTATSNVIAASVIPVVSIGSISGPVDVCAYIGNSTSAVYSIVAVAGVVRYNWVVPTGAVITSGQGTASITVTYNSNFGSNGTITVSGGNCPGDIPANLNVVKNIPAIPGTIAGTSSACGYLGTNVQATYSISLVQYATSYTWTVPSGITIVSGQGTNSINVLFAGTFTMGNINVKSVSPCFSSKDNSIIVSTSVNATPGAISGPQEACPYIAAGNAATYTIRKVGGALSYIWAVPAGASILAHPGGTASNDTIITVTYTSSFVSGSSISVRSAGCILGAPATLIVLKTTPVAPGIITGPVEACPFIGTTTTATYSTRKVTSAVSYNWQVPAGVTVSSHPAGTGVNDTIIKVTFGSSFVSGSSIMVQAVSCQSSAFTSISIASSAPVMPGIITGPSEACAFIGSTNTATYSIRKLGGATSYAWSVPTGVTVSSHPAGSGINDTIIKVTFNNNFVSGSSISVKAVSCLTGPASTLSVLRPLPAAPGPIKILVSPCKYGLYNAAGGFSVPKVAGITYTWSAPIGSVIYPMGSTTGTADTVGIYFSALFTSGTVSVTASNGCGTNTTASSVFVQVVTPATLSLTLSGPSDPCPYLGTANSAVYTVRKVNGVASYDWTVPSAGVTVTHPNSAGENDTIILVKFNSTFTSGNISVKANTGCGSSPVKSINLVKLQPAVPGTITTISTGSCPNRKYIYSLAALPANATSVNWTVPSGGTILTGQGTLSITVSYPATAIVGNVSAYGKNNCNTSAAKTISINLPKCATSGNRFSDIAEVKTLKVILPETIDITVMPNPTYSAFRFVVRSPDMQSPVSLRLTDVNGKAVAGKAGIMPGQVVSFGNDLKAGVYLGIFTQGTQRVTLKLVKL